MVLKIDHQHSKHLFGRGKVHRVYWVRRFSGVGHRKMDKPMQNLKKSEPGMEAIRGDSGHALRLNGALFAVAFEKSSEGMALADASGRVQQSNLAFQQMLGVTAESLAGMNFWDLAHAEDRALELGLFHQLAEGVREEFQIDKRFLCAGGSIVWGRLVATLVRGAGGEPASVLCLVKDISEHTRSQRAIREMAAFAEFNPNPVFEFSPDGGLRYSNKAASELAHSMGKSDPAGILPPETREVVTQCWITGKNRLRLNSELCNRTLSWSFFPIAAVGRVHCYAGDVTEKLALEVQLRQSQKLEAIGQLAAGVAHDFNNILTVIHGNASMFLSEPNLPPGATECARHVVHAAERGASLTRQLLVFSRKQILLPSNLDINEIVENMMRMLQRLLGEHILLRPDFSANLPLIYADPGMMEQVILNLAVNSRDAMPRGGTLVIQTQAEIVSDTAGREALGARPGHFVCLSVKDTGEGIAPEYLARIFEPFFTTKEAGKGTGLGLATVYGIAHQHQGWVEVESKPGNGTAFKIYLPAAAGVQSAKAGGADRWRNSKGSETVLVVEDEATLREMVGSVLQRCGYSVLMAASGHAAMDLWLENKEKIELLFTDLVMPGQISGGELARRFSRQKPGLKVIYTSGYSPEVVARGDFSTKDGAVFLQKPYHPQQLLQVIRDCLDGKQEKKNAAAAG